MNELRWPTLLSGRKWTSVSSFVTLALCLLPFALTLFAQQSAPLFRSGVKTVVVYATVQDDSGRLAPNLTKDDFQIFDNGEPVAITLFSKEVQPITVAVLLDVSDSMAPKFERVRAATLKFIDVLLPDDRARLGSFGEEVALSPLLTGDKATLGRIVSEEMWAGGETPLWNAVDAAMTSLKDETGRRVVLVLTDGGDLCGLSDHRPCVPFKQMRQHALDQGFMLYAIGLEGTGLDHEITDLADESGGGHFQLANGADLAETFSRVADELHHQYVLGFEPTTFDGKMHLLDVRMTQPALKARATRGYLASK